MWASVAVLNACLLPEMTKMLYILPMSATSPLENRRRFQDWASVRYGLMWAYEGVVHPTAMRGEWTQSEPSCWLIRKGQVTVNAGERRVKASEGQWVFVAFPTRTQEFSKDAEILSVHFHFSWPGGEPVIEQPYSAVFDACSQPQLEKSARALVQTVAKDFSSAAAFLPTTDCTFSRYLRVQDKLPRWLLAYLEAQAWLGVYPRRVEALDERVLRVIAELDGMPMAVKFSEEKLAHRVGLGRSQLDTLFRRAIGLSPRRYYERRRLETCEQLLIHTQMSLKEIAIDLGFGSASHFSHWFYSHRNISPSRFRSH